MVIYYIIGEYGNFLLSFCGCFYYNRYRELQYLTQGHPILPRTRVGRVPKSLDLMHILLSEVGEISMFDIEDCVGFQISNAAKIMDEHLNNQLMSLGITRVQWIALYYIGLEKSINQSYLAKKMRIKSSTAARLIDRMERNQYIKRAKHPSDKRIIMLELTEKGSILRDQLQVIAQMTCDELNKKIPEDDYITFINILKNIINSTYYQ